MAHIREKAAAKRPGTTALAEAAEWPRVGPIRRGIGRLYMWMFRWKVVGAPPPHAKAIFVAAPHTTYWDVPFMLGTAWSLGIAPQWFMKHTMFRFPLKWFFRMLGAVPIDRRARHNVVAASIEEYAKRDKFWLIISPPGTRTRTDKWKSGFYHLARGANVPMCCAFLDYKNRVGGLGPTFFATDVKKDMERLRDFYQGVDGKYPEKKSEIRLDMEAEPPSERRASTSRAAS